MKNIAIVSVIVAAVVVVVVGSVVGTYLFIGASSDRDVGESSESDGRAERVEASTPGVAARAANTVSPRRTAGPSGILSRVLGEATETPVPAPTPAPVPSAARGPADTPVPTSTPVSEATPTPDPTAPAVSVDRQVPTFTLVAAGPTHTCGVMTEGSILCWGDGFDYQAPPSYGRLPQSALVSSTIAV